jgi:uncharacterized protein (TIGR02246 family)
VKRLLVVPLLALLVAAAASAQVAAKKSAAAAAAEPSALVQLQKEWAAAANAKDSAKIASLYAEDAVLMPPNAPVVNGRAAIQAFWQGMLDQGARDISLATIAGSVSGDTGYEAGTYRLTMAVAGGTPVSDNGKYLMTVQRGKDGKWLIRNDIFNSDLPCAPAPAK